MNFFQESEPETPNLTPSPPMVADGPRPPAAARQVPASAHPMAVQTHRAFQAGVMGGEEERRWCEFFCAALVGVQSAEGAVQAALTADVAYACLAQRRSLQKTAR